MAWDTEAPADFTYLYHPDRILVRAADTTDFEEALDRNVLTGRAANGTTTRSLESWPATP